MLPSKHSLGKAELRIVRGKEHVQGVWDQHKENAEYADSGALKSVFG